MAKYTKEAQEEAAKVIRKYKKGEYKTIKGRKQAIAIGLSEARRKGDKVPPPRKKQAA
jgi:hypothetical protein